MNPRQALARGGFVAAACVACCAPPIIGALGVTVGLAATAGVFFGLAAAIVVVLVGGSWVTVRVRKSARRSIGPVPAAYPSVVVPTAPVDGRQSA